MSNLNNSFLLQSTGAIANLALAGREGSLPKPVVQSIARWSERQVGRQPYFHLTGYMIRHWMFGGSSRDDRPDHQLGWKRTRLDQLVGAVVACRQHTILRSDDDRALHTHPWIWGSLILENSYDEVVPLDPNQDPRLDETHHRVVRRSPGDFYFKGTSDRHRIITLGAPVKTLFFYGPKIQDWGFYFPEGFVHSRHHDLYVKYPELRSDLAIPYERMGDLKRV